MTIDLDKLEARWRGMPGSAGKSKEHMAEMWDKQLLRMEEVGYHITGDDDMHAYLWDFGPWEIKELLRRVRLLDETLDIMRQALESMQQVQKAQVALGAANNDDGVDILGGFLARIDTEVES